MKQKVAAKEKTFAHSEQKAPKRNIALRGDVSAAWNSNSSCHAENDWKKCFVCIDLIMYKVFVYTTSWSSVTRFGGKMSQDACLPELLGLLQESNPTTDY